jgi:hypothetical protein
MHRYIYMSHPPLLGPPRAHQAWPRKVGAACHCCPLLDLAPPPAPPVLSPGAGLLRRGIPCTGLSAGLLRGGIPCTHLGREAHTIKAASTPRPPPPWCQPSSLAKEGHIRLSLATTSTVPVPLRGGRKRPWQTLQMPVRSAAVT